MADSNTQPADKTTTHNKPPVKSSSLKNSMIAAGIVMMLMVTASVFIDEVPVNPAAEPTPATAEVTPPTPKPVPQAKEPVETISVALPATLQPPAINLSGTWYDDSGTRFEAIQKGKKFIATGFNLFGMASKQMHGTVSGDKLYFTLQDGFIETDGVGAFNEDGEHFDYTLVQGKFREEGQLHLNHKRN
ncbi:MAG: hypothetical protein L3J89_14290 [Gammaproteobacteria bacterium]|nr:hypothetical protein [Gammaproteobacteria bacterium]